MDNDIVLSTFDYLYLDCGLGSPTGGNSWCAPYKTWLHIYDYDPRKADIGSRLQGATSALWAEMITPNNLDAVTWPRGTAFALRLWNVEETLTKP